MNSIPISNLHMRSLMRQLFFLDLIIKLTDGKIVTDLYCKPTDSHQYLQYDLSYTEHLNHTKRLIVFSQTLRL